MVHPDEPALPRTDVSGCDFEVGAPTSEEQVEKKSRTKHVSKSPLMIVPESCLLSILHCSFLVISAARFPSCLQVMPKRFREFPEMRVCRMA